MRGYDPREGFAEVERGETIALTPKELDRWVATDIGALSDRSRPKVPLQTR